jgi:hypothetical protein
MGNALSEPKTEYGFARGRFLRRIKILRGDTSLARLKN